MEIFGLIAGLVVVFGFGTLVFYGVFSEIHITEKMIEPLWLAYQPIRGDYKQSGKVMDRVYADLKSKHALETTRGFGLYYDDPKTTPKEKLRSIAGCILEKRHEARLEDVKNAFHVAQFPASHSVVAEFPFYGKLSVLLGIFSVYPRLKKYLNAHNYPQTPIMEVYDVPQRKIRYIASVRLDPKIFDDLAMFAGESPTPNIST